MALFLSTRTHLLQKKNHLCFWCCNRVIVLGFVNLGSRNTCSAFGLCRNNQERVFKMIEEQSCGEKTMRENWPFPMSEMSSSNLSPCQCASTYEIQVNTVVTALLLTEKGLLLSGSSASDEIMDRGSIRASCTYLNGVFSMQQEQKIWHLTWCY